MVLQTYKYMCVVSEGLKKIDKCKKEGRNGVFGRFQQLKSYHDEIETQNRGEIHFSSQIVPSGLLVAEGP